MCRFCCLLSDESELLENEIDAELSAEARAVLGREHADREEVVFVRPPGCVRIVRIMRRRA